MSNYLLGMEPAEIRRLERQHEVWRSHTARAWALAGFGPGQTIVDLGSGPGFTSLDLTSIVGASGRVIAVDASQTAGDHLRSTAGRNGLSNLEVITADVREVDLAAWKPDGVFARWLFCFLPDPDRVVRQAASALAAGGTIAVMDYWNYLTVQTEPASPLFKKVFRAVYDSFAAAGGSLDVAGRLPALFSAAGLRVVSTEPFCQVGRPGSPVWQWLSDFQTRYVPTLVQKHFLTETERDEYTAWWRDQETNPSAILFTPPILCVVGARE